MNKIVPFLAASVFCVSPVAAQQQRDDLEKLTGRWASEQTAEVIRIEPAFVGWELWDSKRGQLSLTKDGTAGGHIKVSGRGATEGSVYECFYYVSMAESGNRMFWRRVKGVEKDCPAVTTYTYVPGMKTRAEEIADAIAYRNRQNTAVARGPVDMRGIEVIYFEREADRGKPRTAMENAGITFDPRFSESTMPVNVITCQKDVPIEATKHLARTLISAGVPIRLIRPTPYQQFSKRLTVETFHAWAPSRPLITLAQVDALTTCNLNNIDGNDLIEPPSARPGANPPPRPSVRVTIPDSRGSMPDSFGPPPVRNPAPPMPDPRNMPGTSEGPPIPASGFDKVAIRFTTKNCPHPYNVTVKFWSPATSSWQMSHLKGVDGTETFKNGDDTLVTTSTRDVYFFIRNSVTGEIAKLERKPVTFPNSPTEYYQGKPDFTMNCNGA